MAKQKYKSYEKNILTALRDCECVTKILDDWNEKQFNHIRTNLVLEFCRYNLREILLNSKVADLKLDVIKSISHQLFSGIDYIHGLNVSLNKNNVENFSSKYHLNHSSFV